MNDRDIEDTRMPEDEYEEFECDLCRQFNELTGLEVVIKEKYICNTCAHEVSYQLGHWDKMLKAERKVKELQLIDEIATHSRTLKECLNYMSGE